jgi:metaxin
MNAPSTSPSWPKLPAPVRALFARFPLYTHPAIVPPTAREPLARPVLWIAPPPDTDVLSADVECLKWQALLALRGLPDARVRWDVHVQGALDGRLPNLHVPAEDVPSASAGQLLPGHAIPDWLDGRLGALGELEGYVDAAARDESRAWVTLLEGHVHAALVRCRHTSPSMHPLTPSQLAATPAPWTLVDLLSTSKPADSLDAALPTPAAPLFGFSTALYSTTTRVPAAAISARYADAIAALSERLGTDAWLLGSRAPTFLDALLFAYLHRLLAAPDALRAALTKRVNLVAWERRVASLVRAAFRNA